MTTIAETRPRSSANLEGPPTCALPVDVSTQDVERRVALALSILDHGFSTRDRAGRDLDTWLRRVHAEARAALDGASIEQLLEARGA